MKKIASISILAVASALSAGATMSLPSEWTVDQMTAQYTFEGSSTDEILANKVTGSTLPGIYTINNWTAENGTLIAPTPGRYNGLYFGDNGGGALSLEANWGVSMSVKVVQSANNAGLLQFGNEGTGALYIGDGKLGFKFRNGNVFSISLGNSFDYASFHDYAVSFVDSSLQIWLDGQDITENLTSSSGNTWANTVASYSDADWNLKRIAYANNSGFDSLPQNSVLDEVGVYSLQAVPEPATATLSLLGLAALMVRRRRA